MQAHINDPELTAIVKRVVETEEACVTMEGTYIIVPNFQGGATAIPAPDGIDLRELSEKGINHWLTNRK
jgi:hypothetical protein